MSVPNVYNRIKTQFKNASIHGETLPFKIGVNPIPPRFNTACIISVHNAEMFDFYVEHQHALENTCILNMGNAGIPGKDPNLIGAQEEDLFRRSNIHLYLLPHFYPIHKNTVLLSTHVTLVSHGLRLGYKLYDKPIDINVITCPAIVNTNHGKFLSPHDAKIMGSKIETIFYTAAHKQYDTIILSALGCGGYNCPPEHVSWLFKNAIKRWEKHFKNVVFCIQNDENGYGNFQIFKKTLEQ
jgi:uncharacterized protein (TIGR02452 family)